MTVLYDDDAWIDAAMRAQRATLCGHKPSDVIVALARAIASGTDADCFCILEAHDPATIYNRRGNLESLLARAAHHAMTVHGFDYATHASGMIARVAAIARELPRQKPVHVREEIWAYVDNPKNHRYDFSRAVITSRGGMEPTRVTIEWGGQKFRCHDDGTSIRFRSWVSRDDRPSFCHDKTRAEIERQQKEAVRRMKARPRRWS